MSLLGKVKKISKTTGYPRYSAEEIELAIAWAKREIKGRDAAIALGFKNGHQGNLYCYMALALAQYIRESK